MLDNCYHDTCGPQIDIIVAVIRWQHKHVLFDEHHPTRYPFTPRGITSEQTVNLNRKPIHGQTCAQHKEAWSKDLIAAAACIHGFL